jgi:hypothetical protein
MTLNFGEARGSGDYAEFHSGVDEDLEVQDGGVILSNWLLAIPAKKIARL